MNRISLTLFRCSYPDIFGLASAMTDADQLLPHYNHYLGKMNHRA